MKNHIFFLRRKNKINQYDMAYAIGISPSYLSKIETGRQKPTEKLKKACADYLKVSVDDLFNEKDIDKVFPDFLKDIKNKLWAIRSMKGIRQKVLAEKLKVSIPFLSKVEFELIEPSDSFKKKCAKEFKMSVENLFGTE